ncbi:MAG: polyprenyl synthetase family protein [Acidobacteriota bacterium]|nr:polyprenyl synthetase family protein [Acidobacteriota bacterium]
MNLKSFLAETSELVNQELDRLVPNSEIEPNNLHAAIRWSLFAGGKRFRPALMIAVGNCFRAPTKKLLATAAALEMIHTYSLVHDDLPAMDDDDLRRGQPTCHVKFDEATAILAGDALQTLAFQAIAEDENLTLKARVKLISEIARAAGTPAGMVAGQVFDLAAEGKAISGEDLKRIHERKTGAMIVAAARAGAIIAEASEKELNAISVYAAKLGLLFQIVDDLLDVSGTAQDLGKTPGKDARSEKATYPALYGLERAQNLAAQTHQDCLAALSEIEKPTALLREIADFILERKK